MGVLTTSCFSVICVVSALALREQANFDIITGKRVVNATKIIQRVSLISCAASCLRLAEKGECKVAGYHSGSRECNLSSRELDGAVETAENGWKILIPKTGNIILLNIV